MRNCSERQHNLWETGNKLPGLERRADALAGGREGGRERGHMKSPLGGQHDLLMRPPLPSILMHTLKRTSTRTHPQVLLAIYQRRGNVPPPPTPDRLSLLVLDAATHNPADGEVRVKNKATGKYHYLQVCHDWGGVSTRKVRALR